jgi:hypothetical protein
LRTPFLGVVLLEKRNHSNKQTQKLSGKEMNHIFPQILPCNKKSSTDYVPFRENADLWSMLQRKSTSNDHIECLWSRVFLINDDARTSKNSYYHQIPQKQCFLIILLIAQQKIDDEQKIDLTTYYRLFQPAEHWYKQLECRTIALISDVAIWMPSMLDRCFQHYQDCPRELAAVCKFGKRYHFEDAVYWFTKDTFIYRFINKILRLGNIEWFHNMRFYIAHLGAQLEELKFKQKETMSGVHSVYRGLRQSTEELKTLKKLICSNIVTKSFTSTIAGINELHFSLLVSTSHKVLNHCPCFSSLR